MKVLFAIVMLVLNFLKMAVISGFETARLILFGAKTLKSGIVVMPYEGLGENTTSLMGVLITLTPGTTLLNIDLIQKNLTVHMLDIDQKEQNLAQINRDYLPYLQTLSRKESL